jgi:hypothetical protein
MKHLCSHTKSELDETINKIQFPSYSSMGRIEKYACILKALQYVDPKWRVGIVRSGPSDFIKCLIEIAVNLLHGNVPTDKDTLAKLRRNRAKIRHFAKLRGKRGISKARSQLTQKGGLIPLLIPLLAGLGGVGAAAGIAGAVVPSIAKKAARSATNSALDTLEERAKKVINKI